MMGIMTVVSFVYNTRGHQHIFFRQHKVIDNSPGGLCVWKLFFSSDILLRFGGEHAGYVYDGDDDDEDNDGSDDDEDDEDDDGDEDDGCVDCVQVKSQGQCLKATPRILQPQRETVLRQ